METWKYKLQDILDKTSVGLFGITLDQARDKNICIKCKKDISLSIFSWEEKDVDEYMISGMCPDCFPKGD